MTSDSPICRFGFCPNPADKLYGQRDSARRNWPLTRAGGGLSFFTWHAANGDSQQLDALLATRAALRRAFDAHFRGETWEVTGRWQPEPEPAGYQWWVIAPYNTWYRLRAHIQPWGLVTVWSLLPDRWMTGADLDDIPWVDAPWGQVWDVVPYSVGHYLVAKEDLPLALHTCPQVECPVFYQATTNVPVTGVFGQETETWYRVDYKETVGTRHGASRPQHVPAGQVANPEHPGRSIPAGVAQL